MKHTQGEWFFSKEHQILRIKSNGKYVATAHGLHDGIDNEARIIEAEANAKLIAAAPDLLEALQKAKEVIERISEEYAAVANKHASYTNGESKLIEKAIKKATE